MRPSPTDIGPYRLKRPLGQGGMGAVYLATDTRLGRDVAVKVFSGPEAAGEGARTQLLREARAAAAFNHPHIASVHDVLDVDGQVAIVFEYVDGETLADRLKRGRLTADQTIAISLQLTDALAAAHAHGIVHRDLKPANIALTSEGVVKVLDFGVAREMPPEAGTRGGARTTAAGFVGTLGYAAPEQCLGQRVDGRADIFSLGVVLFELLTGRRPFAGGDAASVVESMLSGDPPRARTFVAEVPPELDGLIARMLARDPARRPATARQVRDTLESLAPPPRATAPPPTVRPRRRWIAALLVAAALTAALVGTIVWSRPAASADRPPVVAVLPLTNASGDPSKDYLAIGFAESLITRLASLPSVTVLSRAAVADARARSAQIPVLAAELDASYFVDGAVQQSADGLRISLNLIERNGAVAWADTVQGSLSEIFALQTRTASALGHALTARLTAADRASLARQPTSNAEALNAYWRGRALLERRDVKGNVDAALAAFNEAVTLDTRFADAHAARGEALWAKYVETNDGPYAQQAIASGTEALRLGPDRAHVRYALAVTLEGSGRLDEAVEELQHALALQPNYDDARRRLGQVLARQGQIDEAIAEYEKAIALRPGYWEHHHALGTSLLVAARYREAVDVFRRVTVLQPDAFIGYHQLGTAYQLLGNHDAALIEYTRALERSPNAQTLSNVGAIHHLRGDYREAEAAYRQALTLRPNSPATHRNLGDSLRRQGRADEARRSYQQAVSLARQLLKVNPRDIENMSALAVYLAKVGQFSEALQTATQARGLAPRNARVLFRDAVVNALAGRPQPAIDRLSLAVQHGYSRKSLAEEEDLVTLQHEPAFKALITGGI